VPILSGSASILLGSRVERSFAIRRAEIIDLASVLAGVFLRRFCSPLIDVNATDGINSHKCDLSLARVIFTNLFRLVTAIHPVKWVRLSQERLKLSARRGPEIRGKWRKNDEIDVHDIFQPLTGVAGLGEGSLKSM